MPTSSPFHTIDSYIAFEGILMLIGMMSCHDGMCDMLHYPLHHTSSNIISPSMIEVRIVLFLHIKVGGRELPKWEWTLPLLHLTTVQTHSLSPHIDNLTGALLHIYFDYISLDESSKNISISFKVAEVAKWLWAKFFLTVHFCVLSSEAHYSGIYRRKKCPESQPSITHLEMVHRSRPQVIISTVLFDFCPYFYSARNMVINWCHIQQQGWANVTLIAQKPVTNCTTREISRELFDHLKGLDQKWHLSCTLLVL